MQTVLSAERIAELETKLGRKLSEQENSLKGRMDRQVDRNAPTREILPLDYKPPGKFAGEEENVAVLERREREAKIKNSTPAEQARLLLKEKQDADKLEAEHQQRLASPEVQLKIVELKEIIARAEWDAQYNGDEVGAIEHALLQLETGHFETGMTLVDESLAADKAKWKPVYDERKAAIEAQAAAAATELTQLAKSAGLPTDEQVISFETSAVNDEVPPVVRAH